MELNFHFDAEIIPSGQVLLGIEQPDRWEIRLNGKIVSKELERGWWTDPAIVTLALETGHIRQGRNTLTLTGTFDQHANLECVYLLGDFGACVSGSEVSLTARAARLTLGDWTEQSLAFYSGNVTYRHSFTCDVDRSKRYVLACGQFQGTAIMATLNEQDLGCAPWEPYRFDITDVIVDGKNDIAITVLGSRRNSFGPFHMAQNDPHSVGPYSFVKHENDDVPWDDDIHVMPYGLMRAPVILAVDTR